MRFMNSKGKCEMDKYLVREIYINYKFKII